MITTILIQQWTVMTQEAQFTSFIRLSLLTNHLYLLISHPYLYFYLTAFEEVLFHSKKNGQTLQSLIKTLHRIVRCSIHKQLHCDDKVQFLLALLNYPSFLVGHFTPVFFTTCWPRQQLRQRNQVKHCRQSKYVKVPNNLFAWRQCIAWFPVMMVVLMSK